MPLRTVELEWSTFLLAGPHGTLYKETGTCLIPNWIVILWKTLKYLIIITFSRFYGYTVSNQGVAEKHGDDYQADYFTDRIRDHAVKFISDSAGGSDPFFMYIATPAPHRPATPAPQYEHSFDGKQAPRTASYNDSGQDKHWLISQG